MDQNKNQLEPEDIELKYHTPTYSNFSEWGYKDKSNKAFQALLAYELNAMRYDKPNPFQPTYIPKGERMIDYAKSFGTTVEEMKGQRRAVEFHIKKLDRRGANLAL